MFAGQSRQRDGGHAAMLPPVPACWSWRPHIPAAWSQSVLAALMYGAVALVLLSPLASNDQVPETADAINHVVFIVESRFALNEGQIPLRVAPIMKNGWGYPAFQFYSQVPYLIAGTIYKKLTPDNPFIAYKATLWLALVCAGVFTWRLAFWLFRSQPAALLAGVLYQAAPYLLLNLHARGAFVEEVALGEVPLVLYLSVRWCCGGRAGRFVAAAAAWFALAITHLITFVYLGLFGGLLIGLCALRRPRRLLRFATASGYGALMATFFLAPAYLYPRCMIIRRHVAFMRYQWLTPLGGLLAPVSLPPMPQPPEPIHEIHPAVGLPLLLSVAVAAVALAAPHYLPGRARGRGVARGLLVCFGLALFVTWAPFDFWSYVPQSLCVAQFPYRFLGHTAWTGALLGAFALVSLVGRPDARHLVVGLLAIILAGSSYLVQRKASRNVNDVASCLELTYGGTAYIYDGPRQEPDGDMVVPVEELTSSFHRERDWVTGVADVSEPGLLQLPVLYYPNLLDVRVDGQPADHIALLHKKSGYPLVAVHVDPGEHRIAVRFRGLPWANAVSFITCTALAAVALVLAVRRRLGRRVIPAAPPWVAPDSTGWAA